MILVSFLFMDRKPMKQWQPWSSTVPRENCIRNFILIDRNQFMVEIYEEPWRRNLVHFRAFKNSELLARKSQALTESHNFSFLSTKPKTNWSVLIFRHSAWVLRRFWRSDEKSKTMLMELLRMKLWPRTYPKTWNSRMRTWMKSSLQNCCQTSNLSSGNRQQQLAEKLPADQTADGQIDEKIEKRCLAFYPMRKCRKNLEPDPTAGSGWCRQTCRTTEQEHCPKVDESPASRLSDKVKPQMDEEALAQRLTEKITRVDEKHKKHCKIVWIGSALCGWRRSGRPDFK